MIKVLLFDIEIENAIPERDGSRPLEGVGIKYAAGFQDHKNLGISCIGAWDYVEDRARVFCKDNMQEFAHLIQTSDLLVTFNGVNFDNKVIEASGLEFGAEVKHYDILRELWISDGLNPDKFDFKTHGGYGLDRCVEVNFGLGKTGNGALAPVWYQQGKIGALHDYCLADIWLTKKLFDRISQRRTIKHPKTGDDVLLPFQYGQFLRVG